MNFNTKLQAAKQRISVRSSKHPFLSEFQRMSVPVTVIESSDRVLRLSVASDVSTNSPGNDSLSDDRLMDLAKALNLIKTRNPGTSASLAFNQNSGEFEVDILTNP